MRKNFKVSVVDYGMGNLFSVAQACAKVGLLCEITSNKDEIKKSDALILPGVGAFGDAMDNLRALDLVSTIKDFIQEGKPFMGVCLGMQLLMSQSEEFGAHRGLDVIEGPVVRFSNKEGKKIKVPHVGWNRIFIPGAHKTDYWKETPVREIADGEFMYFVHSYYAVPENEDVILSVTTYEGVDYCSSILYKNVFASQFHPERSGDEGLKIYENWYENLKKL